MQPPFPNDVLLLIGEQLEQKADRWSLILVSRHFHDLFLPLVYREVLIHHWRDANSLLHAILKRPALGRAVRELNVTDWSQRIVPVDDSNLIAKSVPLTELLHIASHSEPESDQWRQDLRRGLADAWVALIIPLLSRLSKLQLAHGTRSPYLDRTMQRALKSERPFYGESAFQHLRDVYLHHREDFDQSDGSENTGDSQTPSSLLSPLFRLPSVRTITANSVIDPSIPSDQSAEDEDPRPGFSSITDIDLRSSSGNHGMKAFVSSCANLKSFKYQHSDSHVLSHGYRPSAFYRSLSHSKSTLRTLWLDHYGSHHPFTAAGLNQSHDEWFGSLADFTALRELRVRLPNLLDIRYQNEPTTPLIYCLPSSLETIYIEGCEERYMGMLVAQLQTVIKSRRTRFPYLKHIDIEGAFRNVPSDGEDIPTSLGPGVSEAAIKDKVYQVAEPLHIDCVHAGLELHLQDRALTHI
ncbi:hypothetical protein N7535_005191 [Penicillium sp. DV-2018c]|nr:hypothetical protein N7461_008770 [Penicillium sp. DV-2018c]KAJ5571531.1 hypothetical protein N7535_005191 [Penicillium sp. DV-2018c]